MLDGLLSVIHEWVKRLNTDWTTAKAAFVDAAISTRAAASTALSTAVWTQTHADRLAAAARRKPVASIVNYFSGGGVSAALALNNGVGAKLVNAASILSGALTANTLATVIDHTGAGVVRFLAAETTDGTSRTVRMKVTIDGNVAFDATTNAITSAYSGLVAVGGAHAFSVDYNGWIHGYHEYDTSLKVEIASSLTETNKIVTFVNRDTRA